MAVQPVIMPKLGAYTEDVLLTEWLVGGGSPGRAGSRRLRAGNRQDDGGGGGRDGRAAPSSCRGRREGADRNPGGADRRNRRGVRVDRREQRRRAHRRRNSCPWCGRGRRWQPVPRLHRARRRHHGGTQGGRRRGWVGERWGGGRAADVRRNRAVGPRRCAADFSPCAHPAHDARLLARPRARDHGLGPRRADRRPRCHGVGGGPLRSGAGLAVCDRGV